MKNVSTKKTPSIKTILKSSYLPQKQAQKELAQYGWTYDPSLSSMQTKTFIDSEGRPVVLHRGSVRVSDWLGSNLPLAFGLEKYAPRFKQAKEVTRQAEQKYGMPVTAIGHSLGGALAEKSGASRVITYNKPVTKYDIGKPISPTQTDIRAQYDPVSALSPFQFGNKVEVPSSKLPLEAHSVSSLPGNIFY